MATAFHHPAPHRNVAQDMLLGPERVERKLGDTEASYFLPSRDDGVNDMSILLSNCQASPRVFGPERVHLVWALVRLRHPVLAAKVVMHSYTDVRYVYQLPESAEDALADAINNVEFRTQTRDELMDSFTNGPRILSQQRLSCLIVSRDSLATTSDPSLSTFHVLTCGVHYLSDGIAFHQWSNEIATLLGSTLSNDDLRSALSSRYQKDLKRYQDKTLQLPLPLEDVLPPVEGRFRQASARVDFQNWQDKYIGGHSFPRRTYGPKHTINRGLGMDAETTQNLVKLCRTHGVSLASAIFSLLNIAWARTTKENPELPMLIYSAIDLRPYLQRDMSLCDSYVYLAISFFNIVLPTFIPRSTSLASTFWHRARSARKQILDSANHPMVKSRIREMARDRIVRARMFAKEDDEKAAGTWVPPPPPPPKKPQPQPPQSVVQKRPPSLALFGISLLGDLDKVYKSSFATGIKFEEVMMCTRQRPGAMLFFGYTFRGKLWVTVGYDDNGLNKDVMEVFWKNVDDVAHEVFSGLRFQARL